MKNGFATSVFAVFSFCLSLLATLPAHATSTLMMPQPKAFQGPWFEGWYVRVTDPIMHRSFATITTSSTNLVEPLYQDSILPGYVAFIYSKGQDESTYSKEFFPKRTWSESSGFPGTDGAHFRWQADGFGEMSDTGLHLVLPSGDEIEYKFGARVPWSASSPEWGPEGWAAYAAPILPLRWYVDSLGTPVDYRIHVAMTGEIVEGRGYAHIEKNWGTVFPKAWMWAQATSPDNSAHLALAGGPINIGPIGLTSYIVGYKTKDFDIEIRPDQYLKSNYKTEIDGCTGTFSLNASNSKFRVVVKAHSPREQFAPVSIPTIDGFEPDRGMESFIAKIDVWLYRYGKLVETRSFEGAALEFGADNMICKKP